MDSLIPARTASSILADLSTAQVNEVLQSAATALEAATASILAANAIDMQRMDDGDPKSDRLLLTEARIAAMASDMRHVATLPSPLGIVEKDRTLDNGLHLRRVSVPFGVIGVIYEARPNVTTDVFALCLKAGSACILKGGSDAEESNKAIVTVLQDVLDRHGLPKSLCTLLPATRQATADLLNARGKVDVIIPRGSANLIRYVRENATIPVIETGAGVCHTYFDKDGDVEIGRRCILNAKTRRVSVCNALDCLIIHKARVNDLALLLEGMAAHNVTVYADKEAYEALASSLAGGEGLDVKLDEEHYGTEFLDYKMAVKVVDSVDAAISHIAIHGSGHSECIITESKEIADRFTRHVDAACVYVNAPTSFTDGAQFGLGAEIGISTQKLHARGPMALEEITTYKWIVEGRGQIRE